MNKTFIQILSYIVATEVIGWLYIQTILPMPGFNIASFCLGVCLPLYIFATGYIANEIVGAANDEILRWRLRRKLLSSKSDSLVAIQPTVDDVEEAHKAMSSSKYNMVADGREESLGTKIAAQVRAECNKMTAEERLEGLEKAMTIINATKSPKTEELEQIFTPTCTISKLHDKTWSVARYALGKLKQVAIVTTEVPPITRADIPESEGGSSNVFLPHVDTILITTSVKDYEELAMSRALAAPWPFEVKSDPPEYIPAPKTEGEEKVDSVIYKLRKKKSVKKTKKGKKK